MEDPGRILLEAVGRGDRNALATLYDQYSAALFGVVSRILPQDTRAEEVLQDAFMKIWRAAAGYDPSKGRAFTWMMNIARNTAIDMVRSAEFRSSLKIHGLEDHVYRVGNDELREQVERIGMDRILDAMIPEQREMIDMAYYQGWSQQEIADRTGLPLGTVKSRTRAALGHLREALKYHR